MKWYWKALIGICFLALLVTTLNIGLNLWIKFQLPKIINQEKNAAYTIRYKQLTVSLWSKHIHASDIVIVPKAALTDTLHKVGIYSTISTLDVNDFKMWDVLFKDRIVAKSITLEHPKFTLYKKKERESIREAVVSPFDKIISVSDMYLNHGELSITSIENMKTILKVHNFNLRLDGILISERILKSKIPFKFRNYALDCDSLDYHPNSFYHIRTKKIQTTNTILEIDDFEMIPQFSRRQFVAKIPKEKDLYTLFCKSVRVRKLDWGFKGDDFFVHCNRIALNHATANIYRSKIPPDDPVKKKLYNKLLRDLQFDLKVDTLQVRNSIVEYEEEKSFQEGPGKLSFSQFNLTATSISSGFKKRKLKDINIKINCLFMKSSPFAVHWKFNVMDKSDGFNIKGTLKNFDAEKIVPFSKPYMNIKTKGIINVVHFNFTGNDNKSTGAFAIQYDDLKFTFYKKKDREKKNKLLTFVANIFVKNDTKGRPKEAYVAVERIPEKSFYNLLWRSVEDGLKQLLM